MHTTVDPRRFISQEVALCPLARGQSAVTLGGLRIGRISHAALLVTVVHGEGHAVLSFPTSAGDLVLDNRRDESLDWRATGYTFVKRQSGRRGARAGTRGTHPDHLRDLPVR